MICEKCGAVCPEGEMFCPQCGAELFTMGTDLDSDIENAAPEIKDSKKKLSFGKNNSENLIGLEKKKKPKPKIEKEHFSDVPAGMPDKPKPPTPVKNRSERANMMLYMKIAGIVLLVLFVIIIIHYIRN